MPAESFEKFITVNVFKLCGNMLCQNPFCEVHDDAFRAGVARILLAQNDHELGDACQRHLATALGLVKP